MGFDRPLFSSSFAISLLMTVNYCCSMQLPMAGFEPESSDVGSDSSANCATTAGQTQNVCTHFIGLPIQAVRSCSFKMGQPRPRFRLFWSFQTNMITIFAANICEKMSIQYTVPGFEPTTFRMWVSSHNE